jgi:transposase-like protein
MAKQIRSLMEQDADPLTGTVEVDETYVGGRKKGVDGRGAKGKTSIVGLVERGGDVKAFTTENVNSTTLTGLVYDHVERDAKVMTDEFGGYNYVKLHNEHKTVAHGKKQYVRGNVHTNTIEGFWSQLKRSVRGTYVHVSKQHMQSYINEFSFRYNLRASAVPIFEVLVSRI